MAKKLTISIPDDLHKELENYRDRITISSICAEAIRKTIDEIDDSVKEAKTRFHLLSLDEACDIAFKRGIHWAGYEATAEELAFLCEWVSIHSKNSTFQILVEENAKIDNLVEESMDSIFEFVIDNGYLEDILPRFMTDENDDIPITNSFRDGAMTVWTKIRNQVIKELLKDPDERLI